MRLKVLWLCLLLMLATLPLHALSAYYPLPNEGSWWTYRVTTGSGDVLSKKRTLLSITDQNDATWDFEFVDETVETRTKQLLSLHETGLFLASTWEGNPERFRRYDPPYPIAVAQDEPRDRDYRGHLREGDSKLPLEERIVIRGVEEVNVPAGVFRALRVDVLNEQNPSKPKSSCWYAEHVGLVKTSSADTVEELTGYHLVPHYPEPET